MTDLLLETVGDFLPVEITRSNWIIGRSFSNGILYEFHYCTDNWYFGGLLIDDVWSQTTEYKDVKSKVDIYVLSKECDKEDDFVLNEKYCFFLKTKNVSKKFISEDTLNNECKNKLTSIVCGLSTKYVQKKDQITLSLVTTVFNNSFLLEQTIQSVINQQSSDFEYIIKDANSKDNFDVVVRKYLKYGVRIIKESDKGIYDGMDQAFRKANGQYIQILNSDDLFYNGKVIQYYIDEINKTHKDAYCSNIKIVFPNEKEMLRKADLSKLRYRSCVNHTSLVLDKNKYIEVGGFDLSLPIAADCDLTIKLVKAGVDIRYLDITCVFFRGEGTSNSTYTLRMLKENLICRYRYSAFNIPGYVYTILQYVKLKFLNR